LTSHDHDAPEVLIIIQKTAPKKTHARQATGICRMLGEIAIKIKANVEMNPNQLAKRFFFMFSPNPNG
jgi:hypothetical protein